MSNTRNPCAEVTSETKWTEFLDARQHKPRPGDCMACYRVMCEFGDGAAKKQLVNLLRGTDKANAVVQVMRKLHFAHPADAIRLPLAMTEDLLAGMTPDQVSAKPYRYLAEMFFYVDPKHVPRDDKHWDIIPLEIPRVSCYAEVKDASLPS